MDLILPCMMLQCSLHVQNSKFLSRCVAKTLQNSFLFSIYAWSYLLLTSSDTKLCWGSWQPGEKYYEVFQKAPGPNFLKYCQIFPNALPPLLYLKNFGSIGSSISNFKPYLTERVYLTKRVFKTPNFFWCLNFLQNFRSLRTSIPQFQPYLR